MISDQLIVPAAIGLILFVIASFYIYIADFTHDKLILCIIIGSGILLRTLLNVISPLKPDPNYASNFLGLDFPLLLFICMCPAVYLFGIVAFIKILIDKHKRGAD